MEYDVNAEDDDDNVEKTVSANADKNINTKLKDVYIFHFTSLEKSLVEKYIKKKHLEEDTSAKIIIIMILCCYKNKYNILYVKEKKY